MVTLRQIEKILKTYDLQEIFEQNEVTEEEVLYFLVEQEFVTLPSIKPVDYNDL